MDNSMDNNSTPKPGTSTDLRRRTLLRTMAQMSPLRKSINDSHNSSAQQKSNDEDERTDRRSQLDIHKRLSNLHHGQSSFNESFVKEEFIICTHLFNENKITSKNAWKLRIIDLLKPLCQNANKETLQVASTSLDISAKVYGIRVDDVHSEGLKLANCLARAERMPAAAAVDDEEGVENEGPEEQGSAKKAKKKKKRVNLFGKKGTVSNSSKSHCGPLPQLEPIEFSTRVNADTGTIDNLYTNMFREFCDSFLMLDKTKTLFDEQDTTIKNNGNGTAYNVLPPFPERVTKINQPFSDFRLDEWDPDHEEKQLGLENSSRCQSVMQQVVFDDDGIPIPELDGSVHDIFENNDADVDVDMNDDDIQSVHEMGAPQLRDGEIARIVDFRETNGTAITSEYSYNSIVSTRSGQFIDQIWAGPCHWKLKFLRRSEQRFSGQKKSLIVTKEQKQRRKKAEPTMIDFTKDVQIDFSKKLFIKKRPPTVDVNKITLPLMDQACAKMLANIDELLLKPGAYPLRKKVQKDSDQNLLDYEVDPYKYENPNDSLYCTRSHDDDDGAWDEPMEDNLGGDNEVEQHVNSMDQQNLANNLVDNPEMVLKSYLAYAMKAKQMDMKKLKAAVWHFLTNKMIGPIDREPQQRRGNVIPTTFSEMYRGLPELLAKKESRELSCPLAFVALLHLCNEQNLELKQISTNKDFHIRGTSDL